MTTAHPSTLDDSNYFSVDYQFNAFLNNLMKYFRCVVIFNQQAIFQNKEVGHIFSGEQTSHQMKSIVFYPN